jgi:hypothetical protein
MVIERPLKDARERARRESLSDINPENLQIFCIECFSAFLTINCSSACELSY